MRFLHWWLHPGLSTDAEDPGRDYQARFALVLVFSIALLSVLRLLWGISPFEQMNSISASLLSLVALISYRYTSSNEIVSFAWLLSIVTHEAVRNWDQPALFFPFFAWIPVSIGLCCFLAGSALGGLFTLVVLVEGIMTVRLARDALLGGYPGDPERLMFRVHASLILGEIIGGFAVYRFARIRERAEIELEQRRLLRTEIDRQQGVKDIVGHLAHELNNPLAIIHAAVIRYGFELAQGKLDASPSGVRDIAAGDNAGRQDR
ncbi:MAG: hypothetical protein EOP10_25840, partial [Proteobacteria bacterium]